MTFLIQGQKFGIFALPKKEMDTFLLEMSMKWMFTFKNFRNVCWHGKTYCALTRVTSAMSFYFLRFPKELLWCCLWNHSTANGAFKISFVGPFLAGRWILLWRSRAATSLNPRYSLFCLARYHEFFLAMTIFILTWLGWLDGDRWQLETFPPNTRGRVVNTRVLTYLMFVSFGTPSHYLGL